MSDPKINTPRLRSMLRQAQRVAKSGKRAAAVQLYEELVAEAPQSVSAWLGLAQVAGAQAEQRAAYERVLALDPGNEKAQAGLDALDGKVQTPTDVEETAVSSPDPVPDPTPAPVDPVPAEPETLVCYRHPGRETNLRCYSCNRPICSSCAVKTPVGYRCPDCVREAEDVFYTAKPLDYVLAPLVALPIAAVAGWLALRFGIGFFIILIIIFAGGAIGNFIGRIVFRVVGRRRGRYLPHTVATAVVIGTLIPAFPFILAILLGNFGVIIGLAAPGILAFVVASAAFYQLR